jgi:hypothetical protein
MERLFGLVEGESTFPDLRTIMSDLSIDQQAS